MPLFGRLLQKLKQYRNTKKTQGALIRDTDPPSVITETENKASPYQTMEEWSGEPPRTLTPSHDESQPTVEEWSEESTHQTSKQQSQEELSQQTIEESNEENECPLNSKKTTKVIHLSKELSPEQTAYLLAILDKQPKDNRYIGSNNSVYGDNITFWNSGIIKVYPAKQDLTKESYDVVSPIGIGSFGQVVVRKSRIKRDLGSNKLTFEEKKPYAMKVLPLSKNSRELILTEVNSINESAALLEPKTMHKDRKISADQKSSESEGVLKVRKVFFDKYRGYIKTNKIEGINLRVLIHQIKQGKNSIDFLILLDMTIEILLKIATLHRKGKVHRDIKPENIMVDPNNFTVTLIDFSLYCDIGKESRKLSGTPMFIAPELYLSSLYGRRYIASVGNDTFAAGVTLKQLWGDISLMHQKIDANDMLKSFYDLHLSGQATELFLNRNVPEHLRESLSQVLNGLCCCDPTRRMNLATAIVELNALKQQSRKEQDEQCASIISVSTENSREAVSTDNCTNIPTINTNSSDDTLLWETATPRLGLGT